jgi:putative tricarboxylic transport membrane protein
MSETIPDSGRGPRHRNVEFGVALATAALGAVAMFGSLQVGIDWGPEGPRAGFFPFYVGLIIVLSSAVNLVQSWKDVGPEHRFASYGQLRSVMSVVVPTAVYVAAMPYLGIYVTSALLIGGFMRWLGRYPWRMTLAVAIGTPLLIYLAFEKWFLVPLPKGPIEDWLGL